MRLLPYKIKPLPYVLEHIKETIHDEVSPFEMISEAPAWLRLLSRGRYCAYKDVIYVPSFHLELVSSKFDEDRTLATAKLVPWVMLLHDVKKLSVFGAIKALVSLKYQVHYFIYEFLFLKATNHKFFDTISLGFMTTRKKWYSKKHLAISEIESYMQLVLDNSKPVV